MTRKSCAVGMRNAILRNYLKSPSRNYSLPLFHCEKDEVLVDLRMRTGLAIEKLHSKFENVDVAVCDNATVLVVLLAPREPVQFIISRRRLALK